MTETDHQTEWLSLSEASELIGVHPSTLRRWADTGTIPCTRTPGGHRRFRRAALDHYLGRRDQAEGRPVEDGAEVVPPDSAGDEDANVQAMMQRDWHVPFVEAETVARMRKLGQRLLGLLLQYLMREEEDDRFLKEGREVGYNYGHESYVANIGLLDAVQAFLYFRTNFAQTASQMPAPARLADGKASAHLHHRIDRFMDAVLLGLISAYEEARGYMVPSELTGEE